MKNLKAAKFISQRFTWSVGTTAGHGHRQPGRSSSDMPTVVPRGLTSLPNHASGPRAVMIHLPHTSLDLSAVMCPFRLPILAVRTPDREAIAAAGVDIAGVEGLEAELWFEGNEAWVEEHGVNSPTVGNKH